MKVKFVYKILPVFIFYTNNFIPKVYGSTSRMMFIFMRPENSNDIGLLEHELTHAKQFYSIPIIGDLLYSYSRKYRLQCEVEAYRRQLEFDGNCLDLFAKYIATNYDLNISVEEARCLLENK